MTPIPDPQLVVDALVDVRHPVKMRVAEWAREALDPGDMIERDLNCTFFREAWTACAEAGLPGSVVPTEFGGGGDDVVTTTLKLEGLGLGCRDNGLSYALASQMLSFQDALVKFGSDDQRADILAPACRGELLCAFAITEAGAGSDSYSMSTRAERIDGGWRITGEKVHITLAPVADVALVFAVTDPSRGRWGISAFLVHAGRPGVEFTQTKPKQGLRTTPFGDIRLDGYVASDEDLLGVEGSGASIFTACMESERALIMASHLGAAERTLHEAIARANSREQFGRPIGSFQAVSHRLVDMAMHHETARLLLYRAAAEIGLGRRSTLAAAMAKLGASEAIASLSLAAARVHGAEGYVTEYEVERDVRDALGGWVYSGTSDIQKNVIAALIGVRTEKS